jgi:hypothetical protein
MFAAVPGFGDYITRIYRYRKLTGHTLACLARVLLGCVGVIEAQIVDKV